jgi:hypothetical protein
VSFDTLLLKALRQQAEALKVNWNRRADGRRRRADQQRLEPADAPGAQERCRK